MNQEEISLAARTDAVLAAAMELWIQCNKGPVRGMRAMEVDKKQRKEFIVQLKKLVDDLGVKFEAVYPTTAKTFDEALLNI